MLARLVTLSDPRCRARLPAPLAADDPVADLAPGAIDVAFHARATPADKIITAVAEAAGAPGDIDGLIDALQQRRQPFTIAVDALDEADDPRALALTLRQLASATAESGVRLLVGTRPGGPDRRLITALGLSTRDRDPALIDLDTPAYLTKTISPSMFAVDCCSPTSRPSRTGRTPRTGSGLSPGRSRPPSPRQLSGVLIGQLVSRALLLRAQPIGRATPDGSSSRRRSPRPWTSTWPASATKPGRTRWKICSARWPTPAATAFPSTRPGGGRSWRPRWPGPAAATPPTTLTGC